MSSGTLHTLCSWPFRSPVRHCGYLQNLGLNLGVGKISFYYSAEASLGELVAAVFSFIDWRAISKQI